MNQARILIAEDDPNFGLVLKSYLQLNHYEVVLCEDGNKAWSALRSQEFQLCILDVMMPYRDGFAVAELIQKNQLTLPVIFLTAKALKEDQIKGYQLGALDYLIKPFDPEILLLKVQAVLNRLGDAKVEAQSYQIGQFTFQPARRQLQWGQEEWKLSPKESDLLQLFCQKQDEVLLREEALHKIWGEENFFTRQSMNVYVTKLRNYFRKDEQQPVQIKNLHGRGFLMIPAAEIGKV